MIINALAYFNFLKPIEPCVLQISMSHSGHLHTTSSNPQLSLLGEVETVRPKSCSQLPCRSTSLCYALNISCLLHIRKTDMVSTLTMVLFLMPMPGSCGATHVFAIVLPAWNAVSHPSSSSEVLVQNCHLWRSCMDMPGHLCLNVKENQTELIQFQEAVYELIKPCQGETCWSQSLGWELGAGLGHYWFVISPPILGLLLPAS